jgi:D-glycero-D-manno-heptose 1,7-bisphosphate phosphatase
MTEAAIADAEQLIKGMVAMSDLSNMKYSPKKAVFLDRDGVINHKAQEGDYIRTWDQIILLPGAARAVASLNQAGFKVFVVTNQRGVATRKVRMQDLVEIHARIQHVFAVAGAVISQFYYCPHNTFENCGCRKPQPGMLKRAALEHNLDLGASWMIGDSLTDVKAGENAGCRSVLLDSRSRDLSRLSQAVLVADTLESAVSLILSPDERDTVLVSTQSLELSRSFSREDS